MGALLGIGAGDGAGRHKQDPSCRHRCGLVQEALDQACNRFILFQQPPELLYLISRQHNRELTDLMRWHSHAATSIVLNSVELLPSACSKNLAACLAYSGFSSMPIYRRSIFNA